jgi:hypothetical protein
MSRVSRNIFSVLLSVIVLITSNGIVLAYHTCLKNSNTNVSLFQNKSCCGKTKKSCESTERKSVKSNCCVSSFSYHKVSVNTVPQGKQFAGADVIAVPVFTLVSLPAFNSFGFPIPVKPPLLKNCGKELLKQLSIFRI